MRLKVPFYGYVLALAGLVLPSVIFAALLPSLINAEPVKARLIAELTDWTGAEVEIAGPVSIESFFSLSVSLSGVAVKRFKGLPPVKRFEASRIVARIAWTDLLFGNLDFDKLKIYNAKIYATPVDDEEGADVLEGLLSAAGGNPFAAFSLSDSRVIFEDGTQNHRELVIGNLAVNVRKSDGRIGIGGNFAWQGERFHLNMRTIAGRAANSQPVPFKIDLASRLLTASFDGQANLSEPRNLVGTISISTPDTAQLSNWVGARLGGAVSKPLSVAGTLNLTAHTLNLQSAALSLDGQNANGDLILTIGGQSLRRVEGSLAFDDLNLRELLRAGSGEAQAGSSNVSQIRKPPKDFDVDLSISANRVRWDALTSGAAAFTVTSIAGLVSVEIAELGLFDGSALGRVQLDFSQDRARARAKLTAENVDTAQLLKAMSQRDWLTGQADAHIEAEAEGNEAGELLKTVTARARLGFPGGGQIRLDIPHLAQSTSAQGLDGWQGIDFARSEFDELRLQLSLEKGQLRCTDLTLLSASGTVRGKGEVDIAKRAVDWQFTVSPNGAEAAARGSTLRPRGDGPEGGLSIKGPWARPAIRSSDRWGRAGAGDPGTVQALRKGDLARR